MKFRIFLLVMCVVGAANLGWGASKKGADTVTIQYDPRVKTSTLRSVGVGHPPEGRIYSAAQRRLLAKRAATVMAYRDLLKASQTVHPLLPVGQGIEVVSGYLQGAQEVETRYYSNGRVEVEMVLPLGSVADSYEGTRVIFSKTTYPVCEIDRGAREISKEEYEELFLNR